MLWCKMNLKISFFVMLLVAFLNLNVFSVYKLHRFFWVTTHIKLISPFYFTGLILSLKAQCECSAFL